MKTFKNIEIRKQKQSHSEVMQILEKLPQGIIIVNQSLGVKLCNQYASQLLEITRSDGPLDKHLVFQALEKVTELKIRHDPDSVLPIPDGDSSPLTKQKVILPLQSSPSQPEALSKSEEKYRSPTSSYIIDEPALYLRYKSTSSNVNKKRQMSFDEYIFKQNFDVLFGAFREEGTQKPNSKTFIVDGKLRTLSVKKSLEFTMFCRVFESEVCLILNINDVTAREKVTVLEDNNSFKDQILSSVSHELRTPLNCNLLMLENVIEDSRIPSEVAEHFLVPALRSAKLLKSMINDIVDLSQLKLNRVRLNLNRVNLRPTLEKCVELLEQQASKKGLKIHLEIAENVPAYMLTDENRLMQIMINLLTNAVKYTFEGEIRINVKRILNNVKVTVSDTGIGLNEGEIELLMKNMEGAPSNQKVNENSTGAGLGLVISHALAKIIGPSKNLGITCNSKVGEGSSFAFFIENKQQTEDATPTQKSLRYLKFSDIDVSKISPEAKRSLHIESAKKDPGHADIPIPGYATHKNGTIVAVPSRFSLDFGSRVRNLEITTTKNISPPEETESADLSLMEISELHRCRTPSTVQAFDSLVHDNCNVMKGRRSSRSGPQVFLSSHSFICLCKAILIVDDDAYNVLCVQQLLSSLSLEADEAYNGAQCLDLIQKRIQKPCGKACQMYKLIIMDCNMPVIDGLEASRKIRELQEQMSLPPIKIIGSTAYGDKMLAKCKQSGMDDSLPKPVTKAKLREILASYYYAA